MGFRTFLESYSDVSQVLVLTIMNPKTGKMYKDVEGLLDSCKTKGISCDYILTDKLNLTVDKLNGKPIDLNTLFVLYGSSLDLSIVEELERRGHTVVNGSHCIKTCRDKGKTALALEKAGLHCPKTTYIDSMEDVDNAVTYFDRKFPLILKTVDGSQGSEVFKPENEQEVRDKLTEVWKENKTKRFILQEKIRSDFDVRSIVCGDDIILSLRKNIIKGDYRSNASLGAEVVTINLKKDQKEQCIRACKAVHGTLVGVDFMISEDDGNMYFLEVNSSSGFFNMVDWIKELNIADKVITKLLKVKM